jgi:hypothetical protein
MLHASVWKVDHSQHGKRGGGDGGDVSAAGFVELIHYYRPAGLPREQQPWLAGVWRPLVS